MASKPLNNDTIGHFLFAENQDGNMQVYKATFCNHICFYLDIQIFFIDSHMKRESCVISKRERKLDGFKWKIIEHFSKHAMPNKDRMVEILKQIPTTFGVWGQEQFDYFNQFLDNVVDVEPLFKEVFEWKPNCPFKTISDIYLKMLRDNDKEDFAIWKSLFRNEPKKFHLFHIKFFAYYEKGINYEISTATTDFEIPVCLKVHKILIHTDASKYDKQLYVLTKTRTHDRIMAPFNWIMKIQNSQTCVKTKAEMEEILKDTEAAFGVWGQEQFHYFHKFLDNVVDVAPLVMEEVSKFDLNIPDVNITNRMMHLSDLFLEMLRKNAKTVQNFFHEDIQKEFQKFIQKDGWRALFREHRIYNGNHIFEEEWSCFQK